MIIRELYEATTNYLAETKINKHFSKSLEKRPLLGWALFLMLLLADWSRSDFVNVIKNFGIEKTNQAALVAVSPGLQTPISPEVSSNIAVGGAEYVTFTGLWRPSDSDAYLQNGLEIFLAEGERQVRFDHSLPVPFGSVFRLAFTLGGKLGGNLQFGRQGAYEITIGDGDFRTVAVRNMDGDLAPETKSKELRFSLEKEIIGDINSEVYITEEILNEETFTLKVKIFGNSEMVYELPLAAKWKENDDIYFALLDFTEGENKTSVYWSEPEIGRFINN